MRFVATMYVAQDLSRIESSGDIKRLEIEAPSAEAAKAACARARLVYWGPIEPSAWPVALVVDERGEAIPSKGEAA